MSEETPINLHSEPDGLQGRPALLQLVTITKKSVDQSKAQVKCNLCEKVMAGTTERMAAHFAKGSNFGVAKCTRSTSEATARGKKVLGEFEAKWAATRKCKAEHSIVESRKTFLRCKDNGEGKEAANKTFLRFLLAPGQSFSIGESPYFRDFVTAVSKVPGWTARERRTLAGTDIDEEYRKVDVESKARLERNGLQRGKTLQTDGMTTKLGVPLVNIIESIDGEERFLTAVDTTGHKKDMPYLLTLVEPNICADTDLLVTDGACEEKKYFLYDMENREWRLLV
eukprot:jgi/Undpi1/9426/HiC_scaffold_27.g11883.m1